MQENKALDNIKQLHIINKDLLHLVHSVQCLYCNIQQMIRQVVAITGTVVGKLTVEAGQGLKARRLQGS